MADLVGAQAVFLLDADDAVLASHGAAPEAVRSLNEDAPGVVKLATPSGSLVVWAGPYSPFFGTEELDLLRSLGALTSLALDRSNLFVREREARLALERADELKTNFIALAAHELRTPVTSVHGVVNTLDRLGDRLSDGDRVELREALRSQSERLRRLVDQLLDLSRLDADSVPIHPVSIAVRDEVEELVAASAGERSQEVEIEIPAELTARIDQTVFERVVSNLLTNALRHGDSPVRVTAARQDRHFRIAVEDCGSGVPAEFVEDLFERFTRSDEARARGLGSGLGLSIARSYARAHGGDLVYHDAPPRGSRFELVVPQTGTSAADD
jgi:signal transduction histidine kinase